MRKIFIISVILLLCLGISFGCGKKQKKVVPDAGLGINQFSDAPITPGLRGLAIDPHSVLAEFFPHDVGAKWRYQITLGSNKPVRRYYAFWPLADQNFACYENVGLFFGVVTQPKGPHYLEYRIKQRAAKQGPLQYDQGVELEIITDTMGVFEGATKVFWAITQKDIFMVEQVMMLDSFNSPADSYGIFGDGYTNRLIFFTDLPMTARGQVRSGGETPETLLFFEITGSGALHFVRIIDPDRADSKLSDKTDDPFEARFIEDTWFESKKGLVKLEQRYGSAVSMTWDLVSYTP